MWPTFFFANSVTNLRFHELCFSDILQWAWLKLPSLFLLQATQILNLGYLRATQVAWTGPSSQGSAVEAESLGLGTDKQAFPASYWSWSFSCFCCSQLPSSHSVLPLPLPSRWYDLLRCPSGMMSQIGHVPKLLAMFPSHTVILDLPEKPELKDRPCPSDTY